MLELQDVVKIYRQGSETRALDGVTLTIKLGEFVAIKGPSGCGKSTLLNIIGLLDQPSYGTYLINGSPVEKLTRRQRAAKRNRTFGFIFQSFNLLPRLTVFNNVMLPLRYRWPRMIQAEERVNEMIARVGLTKQAASLPNQLSGGQQQRVAIARALVNDPLVILADEPTGNLDSKTGQEIMAEFKRIHQHGKTIVMVTHNEELLSYVKRVIEMRDGRIINDQPNV